MSRPLFDVCRLAKAKARYPEIDWDGARELDALDEYVSELFDADEFNADGEADR